MTTAGRLVSPAILRQVRRIELGTRRLVESLFSGEYRSVFRGQGIEFAETRAYEQGDDYRSIDWNVSARMGHPYVKTFVEERELTLLLVVDRSRSLEFGSPVPKSQVAVEVAAVLALAAARHNDRVGAVIFSEVIDHVVRPAKGRGHALRVIRDLLAFEPSAKGTNLAGALAYSGRLLRHRSIVAVISDFRASNWEEPLKRLSSKHEVVAISVEDPKETCLPNCGWLELQDSETGHTVLVNTSNSAFRLEAQMAAEQARLRRWRALAQAKVDHVALRTDRPYAQDLHRVFAQRARRLRR